MWKAAEGMLPQIYFGLERKTQKTHSSHFPLSEGQSYVRGSKLNPCGFEWQNSNEEAEVTERQIQCQIRK